MKNESTTSDGSGRLFLSPSGLWAIYCRPGRQYTAKILVTHFCFDFEPHPDTSLFTTL